MDRAATATATAASVGGNTEQVACPTCSQKFFPWSLKFHTKACGAKHSSPSAVASLSSPAAKTATPSKTTTPRVVSPAQPKAASAAATTPNRPHRPSATPPSSSTKRAPPPPPTTTVTVATLTAEREALVKRIAEIDLALANLGSETKEEMAVEKPVEEEEAKDISSSPVEEGEDEKDVDSSPAESPSPPVSKAAASSKKKTKKKH